MFLIAELLFHNSIEAFKIGGVQPIEMRGTACDLCRVSESVNQLSAWEIQPDEDFAFV